MAGMEGLGPAEDEKVIGPHTSNTLSVVPCPIKLMSCLPEPEFTFKAEDEVF
jgi:hypothetical protein